jgi:uncharacterized protein
MDIGSFMSESFATERSTEKVEFLKKTYLHLAGAILIFIGLEFILLRMPFTPALVSKMLATRFSWLIVLGAFMAVSWFADKMAHEATSRPIQYLALAIYTVAEAVIFIPLIYIAVFYSAPNVIPMAALITGLLFVGLTVVVFTTKKDFSFLGGILKIGFFVALGIIIAGAVFGFSLGLIFCGAMVILACLMILYTTSLILREYGTEQYVAASLSLFASVALLFWYILQIVMAYMNERD